MKLRSLPILVLFTVLSFLYSPSFATAQAAAPAGPASLHGQVADPTGAVIPQAVVTITSAAGKVYTTASDGSGSYQVQGLAPGSYTISVTEAGFAGFTSQPIPLAAGQIKRVDISMAIQMEQQQVIVTDETPAVSVEAGSNASALVLRGKDLDALSDDPDELSAELTALAGPSAGPNGGQIYIDGFTGGQLPPKSAIREIRVNQNPFSAEYDKLGYGRIEILTKPGTDKLHGQFFVQGNTNQFNSKNPFACTQATNSGTACTIPDYHTLQYDGNISDSLGKNRSVFVNFDRRQIQDNNIVNAITLGGTDCSNPTGLTPAGTPINGTFTETPCSQAVPAPSTRMNFSPRFDFQFGANATVTVRYQYESASNTNSGIGQFNLASEAYNSNSNENTLQVSETQVLSPRVINETHFQYQRDVSNQTPASTAPTLQVSGTFYTGGNSSQMQSDVTNHFELQNYTSLSLGNNSMKFGGRLRTADDSNVSKANSNGTFTFGARPYTAPANLASCAAPYQPAGGADISALQAFEITEACLAAGEDTATIRANGGGASQYSVTYGNSAAAATLVDAGLYLQDDWKIRPKLTLSGGLRWESQNQIDDHSDWAPRLGFAWGVGRSKTAPKTVIRGGYGIFFDRFPLGQVLQAQRQSGSATTGFVESQVTNPDTYPNSPCATASSSSAPACPGSTNIPTVYQIDPTLHSPYTMQFALGADQQLGKYATMSVTYLNTRGEHQLVSRNANAPLPGTYDPSDPTSGTRPNGTLENVEQYYSEAIFRQNQLIVNFNVRAGTRLSLFGFYQLGQADSDTGGVGSFTSNPYDIMADYGRASFNARNRLFVGGTLTTRYDFRLSPFVVASSGNPYNITVSQDLNGDGVFNDRPSFSGTCSGNSTAASCFNPTPASGSGEIPVNYAIGPGQFTFNLRGSKTIGIGPKLERRANSGSQNGGGPPAGGIFGARGGRPSPGGTSDRRYNLTFNVQARNLFNDVNYASPEGQLGSPLYGKYNALGGAFGGVSQSANRRIDLQLVFSF